MFLHFPIRFASLRCQSYFQTFVETNRSQPIILSEKELDGYEMNDQKYDGADDCAQMTHLSEASVLHNLKTRYECDCIYVCHFLFVFPFL